MSTSSSEPTLSVVVASGTVPALVERCLASLEAQRDGVEVIVCEGRPSPPELRERYGWARFVERPGLLVPELWREGIEASHGETVALTIAQMRPAADWIEALRRQRRTFGVVGGAIDPDSDLRLVDWAEFLCRYARDMLPFAAHECIDVPGDNAAYGRDLLERTRSLYRDGFWEPVVHRHLAREGVVLWHAPDAVVRQGRSAGWRSFVHQRLVHGRAHGRQRAERFGAARNAAGVLGAPLVPPLLTLRILREVARKRRHRLRALAAVPFILVFNAAWALGEARGHLEALARR